MKRHQSDYIVVAYWAHKAEMKRRRREAQDLALLRKGREVAYIRNETSISDAERSRLAKKAGEARWAQHPEDRA